MPLTVLVELALDRTTSAADGAFDVGNELFVGQLVQCGVADSAFRLRPFQQRLHGWQQLLGQPLSNLAVFPAYRPAQLFRVLGWRIRPAVHGLRGEQPPIEHHAHLPQVLVERREGRGDERNLIAQRFLGVPLTT